MSRFFRSRLRNFARFVILRLVFISINLRQAVPDACVFNLRRCSVDEELILLGMQHTDRFLGITFDSQLNFKKHFEDILDRCNTRYYRLRLLANKKWGPSPSTLIQIYKQCVRPIFEYGALSTITTSDNIISKIQRLQNKFIRLALRLPKYICSKLLHDSTGLPYVKDRLLSCATKSLDRIAQNPLVEESISRNRLNPAWDRFPTPLSVVRPGQPSA